MATISLHVGRAREIHLDEGSGHHEGVVHEPREQHEVRQEYACSHDSSR